MDYMDFIQNRLCMDCLWTIWTLYKTGFLLFFASIKLVAKKLFVLATMNTKDANTCA